MGFFGGCAILRSMTDKHNKKSAPKPIKADVVMVGGGLMGLSLATILGIYGVSVVCIEKFEPPKTMKPEFDGRTTALSLGSRRVLEAAGIWDQLEPHTCPIDEIRVADGTSPMFLHFDHREIGDKAFGWIIDNRFMRSVLYKQINKADNVTLCAPATANSFERDDFGVTVALDDGQIIQAKILIGADGQNSTVRDWAGITTHGWDYKQTAIVCCVDHELDHENIAVEHFLPDGPFAILPMKNDTGERTRSSVVWSIHGENATAITDLNDDDFNAALNEKFGNQLGTVSLVGGRYSYPLSLKHAKKYTAVRMALIGEAAHKMHPIAGQGLNLGMRDVALLAELIVDQKRLGLDLGARTLTTAYERRRRFDNQTMMMATDGLNRLFSNDIAPVRWARQIGLGLVEKTPFAKRFFMRQAMGLSGANSSNAPKLLRGKTL